MDRELEVELASCPFCGGEAQVEGGYTIKGVEIGCANDECVIRPREFADAAWVPWNSDDPNSGYRLEFDGVRTELIAAWNTRYDAGRSQWVAIRSDKDLPMRPGIYYVTTSKGNVITSAFYVGAFDQDAIAWLPRPEAYRTPEDKQ